jgi:alpha-N-arabinofuranosidase
MLDHWAIMGQFDAEHRTKLVVDEWGNWYPPGEEIVPGFTISQPITLRDALHTALTFDAFNRHAEKVAMANVAQTINCLHSLFLAHEDKFVRTPVYDVFAMYRGHMGGRLVPLELDVPEQTVETADGDASLALVNGSASVKDNVLTVTLTNSLLESGLQVRLRLDGVTPSEAHGTVLTHEDRQAANTFDNPRVIASAAIDVATADRGVSVKLPKQSVVSVSIRLS